VTNSLQDQLLKTGLVNKTQVSKAHKAKHKKARQSKGRGDADQKAILAEQSRQQKIARDRDLNQEVVTKQKRKAALAELRQLFDTQSVADSAGEIAFNFQHKRKIKQLNVSNDVHARLVAGRLAIAHFEGKYRLIPASLLEKVRQRDANCFTFVAMPDSPADAVDEYGNYEVPDDLTW